MTYRLRRTRAVLRQFDPNQHFFHSARIVVGAGIVLETYWRNPELHGVWLFTYEVTPQCFAQLEIQELIVLETYEPVGAIYRLSAKGYQRLRES